MIIWCVHICPAMYATHPLPSTSVFAHFFNKGTPKQFDSGGEIQIWKDVCFWLFFQFLWHMPQRNYIYFQYCLLHWVDVTKINFVCYTESLRQMIFLFVALSHCDKQNWYMLQQMPKCVEKEEKNTIKRITSAKKVYKVPENGKKVTKKASLLAFFGIFLGTSTNFVCHSD